MNTRHFSESIFTIENFLSDAECEERIAVAESIGFSDAPVGEIIVKSVRDNTRVMVDDLSLATSLWQRAKATIPQSIVGWRATGFNERLRYYKYDVGQSFAPHHDGYFRRSHVERSRLTFLVYLNDVKGGGETRIFDLGKLKNGPSFSIAAKKGTALVFPHEVLHEGAAVTAGRKYVLRSDVMYSQRQRKSERSAVQH